MEGGEEHIEIAESNIEEDRHVFVFFVVTILMAAIVLVIIFGMKISGTALTAILVILSAFYISAASILLEPRLVKHMLRTVTKTEEKEVIVEKPVYTEIVKEIDRPVYVETPVEVVKEIEKKVYVPIPRKGLNIPKYEYLASTETKTYHSRNCRLGKLIKRKYKVSNNSRSYFIKRKFSPCKVCIKKVKKI